ncbi:hypothetical protein K439DRAFT_1616863 [Ramaria rubella]|nr:hypothetical protein K439DRAFT_1616863 [Ramaria rubella]
MPHPPDINTLVILDLESPCHLPSPASPDASHHLGSWNGHVSRRGKLMCSVSSSSSCHNHRHPSRTGSLLPAGVRKRGRPSVTSLPSSNIAPPPSPGHSSEPPMPDRDSQLNSDCVPDYSLETALRELIVLRCKARQLEDCLDIECQCRFVLEDRQMQDRLTRHAWEDEVLLEAIDAAANITNCIMQPNARYYTGAQGGDPSMHLQVFLDDLQLGCAIEKEQLRPIFETTVDPTHVALEAKEREVLGAWNRAWWRLGNQCGAHWKFRY